MRSLQDTVCSESPKKHQNNHKMCNGFKMLEYIQKIYFFCHIVPLLHIPVIHKMTEYWHVFLNSVVQLPPLWWISLHTPWLILKIQKWSAKNGNLWHWDFPKNKSSHFSLVPFYFLHSLNAILPHLNSFSLSELQDIAWILIQKDICLFSLHLSLQRIVKNPVVLSWHTLGTAETWGCSLQSSKIVTCEVTSKANEALQSQFPSKWSCSALRFHWTMSWSRI